MTESGVILGTAPYMAPEQARGQAVDRRADIWAFGCVLYEMVSGRRAFRGATITDVSVAILTAEPDWSALPAATPPHLRRVLNAHCRRTRSVARVILPTSASSSKSRGRIRPLSAPCLDVQQPSGA